MKDKTSIIIVVLAVIGAFLAGSFFMKNRYQSQQKNAQQQNQQGQQGQAAGQAQQPPEFNASKSEKPDVKFFVMSFCPYGNQAEYGLKPVYELLGDSVTWEPVYIVSDAKQACEQQCAYSVYDETRCQQLVDGGRVESMEKCKEYFPYTSEDDCLAERCVNAKAGEYTSLHGEQEMSQDVRELCAWEMDSGDMWWDFVDRVNKNCTYENADTCWEEHASAAGYNASEISSCESQRGGEILAVQTEKTNEFSVQGSPTVYINGVLYQGGRTPEEYKKAICSSFETAPEECNTVLSTGAQASVAPGSCN